jgi:hypothetical protein
MKPSIPELGRRGIPMRDELVLERRRPLLAQHVTSAPGEVDHE